MDPQNEPFPVPVTRNVGGMTVQEIQAHQLSVLRGRAADGMDKTSPIVSQLTAVTLNWASPIVLDEAKNAGPADHRAARSPADQLVAAHQPSTSNPTWRQYRDTGFPVEGEQASATAGGGGARRFESYFKGKPSPLSKPLRSQRGRGPADAGAGRQAGRTIESSPDTARLVVVGSAEFLTDVVFQISSSLSRIAI